jgi:hypothetical protein
MDVNGSLNTVYTFCGTGGACTGEFQPVSGLVQGTDGNLYGTSWTGGTDDDGIVFSDSVGLGPLLRTVTAFGKVGAKVMIIGSNLTGATAVSFNGTPATTFKVVSNTEMTATVPSGAGSGLVSVTTASGAVQSANPFLVTPQITGFSPTSGPSGTQVVITGVSLLQTLNVSIGGTGAAFTIQSDTQITATVPGGTKTGHISVTTQGGTVTSTGTFTVN